jgi:ribosomal protein L29
MAKMNVMQGKIKAKSDQELGTMLAEARTTLREERFAAAGSRPKDSNSPGKLRKQVARILTEQRARSLRSAPAARVATK